MKKIILLIIALATSFGLGFAFSKKNTRKAEQSSIVEWCQRPKGQQRFRPRPHKKTYNQCSYLFLNFVE